MTETDDKAQSQDTKTDNTTADAGADSKGIQFSAEQQAYLNKLISDARRDGRESEKKKYSDYTEAKAKAAKLEELENAKKSDEEKATARLKALEDKIAEKEKELAERGLRDLKRSKIEQAIADGKMELPKGKTVDSLVKRMFGATEEEIDSDIEDLIGFFPKAEPPKNLGTPTKTGDQTQTKTLQAQLDEVNQKLKDTKIPYQEKTALIDLALQINRKISRGET